MLACDGGDSRLLCGNSYLSLTPNDVHGLPRLRVGQRLWSLLLVLPHPDLRESTKVMLAEACTVATQAASVAESHVAPGFSGLS